VKAGAVIVTGGRSRRLGRAKEWMEVRGEPSLARVVRVVGGHCSPVVVAAASHQSLPPLPSTGVVRVDDPPGRADRGPVVGLAEGLRTLDDLGVEIAYLGSCDAANLSEGHVAHMLDRLLTGAHLGAVPESHEGRRGWLHPLAAAVNVNAGRRALEQMISEGEWRARRLFSTLERVVRVPVRELPDPAAIETFNTPAEWATLAKR
jgi:molybdopterin-guanine dinucleotide biosynthesis protein A